MCGFAGRFSFNSLPPDPEWIAKADAALAHRGPDGKGAFADAQCELMHRRLALIDLSPTGHQPMANEDGSVFVIFNGEVYNHQELRRELLAQGHRFRGTSDTEVLVHLYEEHGAGMVERLRGMFAFAVYDQRRRQILLARDRFGIKPLYYAELNSQLVFASEIKAILEISGFRPTINRQACYDYLGMGYIPEPQTGFAEVRALPLGHLLIASAGRIETREYYRVQTNPDQNASFNSVVAHTGRAMDDAVQTQSVADVEVAALLSGGIDSSLAVASYCRTTQTRPTTFNVSFPDRGADQGYDETPFALAVSDQYGTNHHTITLDDFGVTPELTQKLLLHFDQPFADSSLIPTYFVSKAIRDQGIICALSGDGGDEAFGGYPCFWRANHFVRLMKLPRLVQSAAIFVGDSLTNRTRDFGRQLSKAIKLAQAGKQEMAVLVAGLSNYLTEEQKSLLVQTVNATELQPVSRLFNGYHSSDSIELEELSRQLTETHFKVNLASDMLRKVDMMSMLAGIEVRVPFLDERMVEIGLSLPHRLKTDGQTGKLVLRELARQWLPESVATHPKKGFRIPLDRLATPRFYQMLEDLLLSPQARIRGVLDETTVRRWVEQFKQAQSQEQSGQLSREALYQLILITLALELWLRKNSLNW
ncbi:MAG: asparagine synthase (glutamine-hydrolyzing) [Acidobacteriota bacterium]